jgi:hypothetical protein
LTSDAIEKAADMKAPEKAALRLKASRKLEQRLKDENC